MWLGQILNNKIQKDQRSNCHFWRDRSTVHAPCTHHHQRGGQTIYATAPAGPLDTLPPSFHKRNQLAYPLGEQAIKGTCYLFSLLSAAAAAAAAKSLQSCPTLCDPIDGSPPGSPVLKHIMGSTLELYVRTEIPISIRQLKATLPIITCLQVPISVLFTPLRTLVNPSWIPPLFSTHCQVTSCYSQPTKNINFPCSQKSSWFHNPWNFPSSPE